MSTEPTTMTITRLISPEDWVEKQMSTVAAVGKSHYLAGIARPQKSPIGAGSSDWAEAKYNTAMMEVLERKARQKGTKSSSDEVWFGLSKTLGAENYVKGVKAREAKVKAFVSSYQPKLATHVANLDKMPVATLDERAAKMTENMKGLAALHGTLKGY